MGWIEVSIANQLEATGNPWNIDLDEVNRDLFSSFHPPMTGYKRMAWTVAHYDRNHWVPENPADARELWIANDFRRVNPEAAISVIVWDLPMTHYGHVELPQPLAEATFQTVQWLVR